MADQVPGPGCEACRYLNGLHQLGESNRYQSTVHRCRWCGTYWNSPGGSYPYPVTVAVALEHLSEPQPMTRDQFKTAVQPLLDAAGLAMSGRPAERHVLGRDGTVRWSWSGDWIYEAIDPPARRRGMSALGGGTTYQYLATKLGEAARATQGLAPIDVPTDPGAEAAGFGLMANEDGYVLSHEGRQVATFTHSTDAVAFSHLRGLDLALLVRLYLLP